MPKKSIQKEIINLVGSSKILQAGILAIMIAIAIAIINGLEINVFGMEFATTEKLEYELDDYPEEDSLFMDEEDLSTQIKK